VSNVNEKTTFILFKLNPLIRPSFLDGLTHLLSLLLRFIYFILKFDDIFHHFYPATQYSSSHESLQFFDYFYFPESFPPSDFGIVQNELKNWVICHLIVAERRVKHHLMLCLLPLSWFRYQSYLSKASIFILKLVFIMLAAYQVAVSHFSLSLYVVV
jgi:hypothetical protein